MNSKFAQPRLRDDWYLAGWHRFLPFEGEMLWHVVCDATAWEVDGDVDALLAWQESMHPVLGPHAPSLGEQGLDRGLRRPRRRTVMRMLAAAGHTYPRTMDQVARLGVELGLFERHHNDSVVRWRVPAALRLPGEVLAMSPRQQRSEDRYRWLLAGSDSARRIAELLLDSGESAESIVSVGFLAQQLRCPGESVRQGLEYLCAGRGGGYMRVYVFHGPRRCRINPQRLRDDDPCVVVPQWRRLWKRFGLMWHLEGRGALGLAGSDATGDKVPRGAVAANGDRSCSLWVFCAFGRLPVVDNLCLWPAS